MLICDGVSSLDGAHHHPPSPTLRGIAVRGDGTAGGGQEGGERNRGWRESQDLDHRQQKACCGECFFFEESETFDN